MELATTQFARTLILVAPLTDFSNEPDMMQALDALDAATSSFRLGLKVKKDTGDNDGWRRGNGWDGWDEVGLVWLQWHFGGGAFEH